MRFACVSDTHGRPPNICLKDCDRLLHAGDFYNEGGSEHFKTKNCLASLKGWMDALQLPAHAVRGNHDCEDPLGWFAKYQLGLSNFNNGSGIAQLEDGLFLFGIGWTGEKYYDLPLEKNISQYLVDLMKEACYKMKDGDRSIVLTHFPAAFKKVEPGFTFECIKKLIEAIRPLAVVSGHIHSDENRFKEWEGTFILPVGETGCYLDVEGDSVSVSLPLGALSKV